MRSVRRGEACLVVGVLFLAFIGCSGGAATDGSFETWSELPLLSADTVAVVGGSSAEGPYALGRVVGVNIVDRDGDLVAVADGTSRDIRFFNMSGDYVRSQGRQGDGPGEYQALSKLFRFREGLAAWDRGLYRLSVLGSDGAVGVHRLDLSLPLERELSFIGSFADGQVVVQTKRAISSAASTPTGQLRDTLVYARTDTLLHSFDTITTVISSPADYYNEGVVFGAEGFIFGSDVHATVGDRMLFVASGDSTSVAQYAFDGSKLGHVLLPPNYRSLSTMLVNKEREHRLTEVQERFGRLRVMVDGHNVGERIVNTIREVVQSVPVNAVAPVFDRLLADGDTVLWLRERKLESDTHRDRWIRFRTKGGWATQMLLPDDQDVVAARTPFFVVQATDSLDAAVLLIQRMRER